MATQPQRTVEHKYIDFAAAKGNESEGATKSQNSFDGNFPVKLHVMLNDMETDGLSHIAAWQPHGRCFVVHKQHDFVKLILPLWFRQSKISSFQRQLNLYGFKRITIGQDKGGHYHELFLRGKQFLARRIPRFKVKNEGARKPTCPESEPDFYSYPSLRIELPLKENGSLKQPDSLKRTAFESIITAHTPGQNCPPVTTLGSDSAAGMVMTLPNAQLDTFLLHQQALLASRHCAAPILPAPLATMAPLAPSSVSILAAQWIAYNARNNNTVPMNPMPLISLPINASPPTHNSVAALSTQSSLHGLVSNDDLLRVALLENSSLRAGNLARSDNYTGVILSELQMATLARDYGSTTISAAAAAINDAGSAAARGIASFGRLQ